jgi:membrane protease YdiL (CAAX protease family)
MKLIIAWFVIWVVILIAASSFIAFGYYQLKRWRDWLEVTAAFLLTMLIIALILWSVYTVSK